MLVRQTIKISGINGIALTKLDVLDELDEIKMCVEYDLNGKKLIYLPAATEDQFNIKPIYKSFPGWKTNTQGIRNIKDLPENAKKYIYALEDFIGAKISQYFNKPKRDDTILIEDPFKSSWPGVNFFDLLAFIIDFCNFSKAFVSICLILSLLILYFLLKSSSVNWTFRKSSCSNNFFSLSFRIFIAY